MWCAGRGCHGLRRRTPGGLLIDLVNILLVGSAFAIAGHQLIDRDACGGESRQRGHATSSSRSAAPPNLPTSSSVGRDRRSPEQRTKSSGGAPPICARSANTMRTRLGQTHAYGSRRARRSSPTIVTSTRASANQCPLSSTNVARLITRRSQVQILPPPPTKYQVRGPFRHHCRRGPLAVFGALYNTSCCTASWVVRDRADSVVITLSLHPVDLGFRDGAAPLVGHVRSRAR